MQSLQSHIPGGFSVYRLAHSNLYAAIPAPFLRLIRQCVAEYQGLGSVPENFRVKGIILPALPGSRYQESHAQPEQDIPINSLRF